MDVFGQIFGVFLALGTLVGVIVIGYMLYNAYKYRADGGAGEGKVEERPQLGELPTGGGGGRKLALSFTLSAIIVVSLIAWTYGTLLYVEGKTTPAGDDADLTVEVVGHQFFWEFIYPNGESTQTLVVPEDAVVKLEVTSADVMHNFGIPELRVKADAMPGEHTETWFIANETGSYTAHCYELCGSGHSFMDGDVDVRTQSGYEEWYAGLGGSDGSSSNATGTGSGNATNSSGTGAGQAVRAPSLTGATAGAS